MTTREDARPGQSRARWLVPLALVLAALVGGGALLLRGGGDSPPQPSTSGTLPPTSPPTSLATVPPSAAPAGPIRPAVVLASLTAPPGVEASGARVTYDPVNTIDGNPATAWRAPGDGRGVVLSVRLPARARITRVGVIPGYAKFDPVDGVDRFTQNRRIVRVLYGFGGGRTVEVRLADARILQFTDVDAETDSFTIEILETTPDPVRDFTAISEIAVEGVTVPG